jgi:lipoprotein NlpI
MHHLFHRLFGFFFALLAAASGSAAQESPPQHPLFPSCLAFERTACDAVVAAEPANLTALFMRGLAAELRADDAAALVDFTAVVTREPRHFGAQLWRHVAAATLGQADAAAFRAYLDQATLPPWPKGLGLHYLGAMPAAELLAAAAAQPAAVRAEALCAAHYHIGRAASLAGDGATAMAAFRDAVAMGATHVFEHQAAEQALAGIP